MAAKHDESELNNNLERHDKSLLSLFSPVEGILGVDPVGTVAVPGQITGCSGGKSKVMPQGRRRFQKSTSAVFEIVHKTKAKAKRAVLR